MKPHLPRVAVVAGLAASASLLLLLTGGADGDALRVHLVLWLGSFVVGGVTFCVYDALRGRYTRAGLHSSGFSGLRLVALGFMRASKPAPSRASVNVHR